MLIAETPTTCSQARVHNEHRMHLRASLWGLKCASVTPSFCAIAWITLESGQRDSNNPMMVLRTRAIFSELVLTARPSSTG